MASGLNLEKGQLIVYPAHGVGMIEGIEKQNIAGIELELLMIRFDKDRLLLKLPMSKIKDVGLRKLCSQQTVKKAIEALKTPIKRKKTMWSRRAQEYEAKINSGDLVAIAEVMRSLYRVEGDINQSYSERQIYQEAFTRFLKEYSAVENIEIEKATKDIEEFLSSVA